MLSAPLIKCLLFFLSERTIITVRPTNKQVDEGTRVDLRCEATADPSLELRYYWKRDNAVITYNNKIRWLEGAKVLTITSITVDDAGNYNCVAYTPYPKRSEDQASATIDVSGTLLVYTFTLRVFRKNAKAFVVLALLPSPLSKLQKDTDRSPAFTKVISWNIW